MGQADVTNCSCMLLSLLAQQQDRCVCAEFTLLAGRLGSDDLMFGRFSRSDVVFRSDVQGADLMEHRSDVFSPI